MWLTIRSLTNPAVIWTYHKKQSLWCMIFSNYKERQTSSFTLWQLIDHLLQIQSTVQALHCVVTLIYIIKVLNYKARTISSMPWPDHDRLNLKILVQILDSRVVTCQVFFLCVCVCVSAGDLSQDKVHWLVSFSAWLSYSCEQTDPSWLLHFPLPCLTPSSWFLSFPQCEWSHPITLTFFLSFYSLLLLSSEQNRWLSSLNLCKLL